MIATRSVLVAIIFCGVLLEAAPSVASEDAKATGLITLGGKPLTAGKVTFHRDNGQFVGSKVKDGKYTIDRMPVGTLKVTFEGKGVSPAYTIEETSPLVVEVKDGPVKFDFNLN